MPLFFLVYPQSYTITSPTHLWICILSMTYTVWHNRVTTWFVWLRFNHRLCYVPSPLKQQFLFLASLCSFLSILVGGENCAPPLVHSAFVLMRQDIGLAKTFWTGCLLIWFRLNSCHKPLINLATINARVSQHQCLLTEMAMSEEVVSYRKAFLSEMSEISRAEGRVLWCYPVSSGSPQEAQ